MMLIELASYVGDVLSYYIDYNYKENILATATEKRNVVRLSEFLGYKVSPNTPSLARLRVTTDVGVDADGNPDYSSAPQNPINSGLQIESNIDSNTIASSSTKSSSSLSISLSSSGFSTSICSQDILSLYSASSARI